MDSVNLQVNVEQVNYEDNESLPSYSLNRSSPQPPLDNVIDPNTEFKRKEHTAAHESASPEISFGLKDVINALQNKNSSRKDSFQADIATSHPLYQQLQEAYTAVVASRASTPGDGALVQVHTHSPRKSISSHSSEPSPSHNTTTPISSPAQVATILKETEPKLVSDILYLMKKESSESCERMEAYRDGASNYSLDMAENNPTSPILMGSKPLHKYPPGHVTISCEKGAPNINEPQIPPHAQRGRTFSQSSHGSVTNHNSISNSAVDSNGQWSVDMAPRYSSISNISDISLYNPEQRNIPHSPIPMRSPEQIAWAMRTARDRFETGSNFSACSSNLDSVCSERLETMSMISDVSGYEEEMFRIKKLLLDPSAGRSSKYRKPYIPPPYNKQQLDYSYMPAPVQTTDIVATHCQTQNKKQHQNELLTMEKNYELKIQDLLRNQAHTEGKLEAARSELERFIKEHGHLLDKIAELESKQPTNKDKMSKLESEVSEYHQKISQLEGNLKDCQNKLQQRELETQQWREERQVSEGEVTKLRLEAEDLRIELDTKTGAVEGLRSKVADQHSELQTALHAKLQAEGAVASSRAESEALRSSQAWYKDQLAKAQAARSAAQQQATAAANELLVKDANMENLRSQISLLSKQLSEAERQAVREKRAMLQQLETFEADMVAREAELTHRVTGTINLESPNRTLSVKISQLEGSNLELQQQVESLKSQLKTNEELTNQLSCDHAQLLGRATTLRQSLAERDLQLQQSSDQLSALDAQNCRLREELRGKEFLSSDMLNHGVKLQVSLDAANREKAEVDKAIENLSNEFTQLSTRYKRMQQDIRENEGVLANLQTNLNEVTIERDNLKEELKETKLKSDNNSDIVDKLVVDLKQENEIFKSKIFTVEQDRANFEKEISNLKNKLSESESQVGQQLHQNQELAGRIAELTAAKGKAERKAIKLQESLKFREDQLYTAQQGMEAAHSSQHKATEKSNVLEHENSQLKEEIKKMKDELERSDSVVQQYAELCRTQATMKPMNNDGVSMSDKTTMSDAELVKKSSSDFSAQYNPDTQNTGTEIDNLSSTVNAETLTSVQVKHEFCQTDIVDVEKEKLITSLKQKVTSLETVNTQQGEATQLKLEINQLKVQLEKMESQAREVKRKNQVNVGTLLRTLKEHMRGRKSAEKELEIARTQLKLFSNSPGDCHRLNQEIAELQEQLRVSKERLEQLKETEKKASEALIELERERGRLEGVSSSQESLRTRVAQSEQELASVRQQLETSEKNREAEALKASQQIAELQKAANSSAKMVQDLHKQVLNERRELTNLRQQLSSTHVGLDTANQLLETRGTELVAVREQLDQQQNASQALQVQLTATQTELRNIQIHAEALVQELQLSKEKDPIIADQLKRLSEHAQLKSQEATASQQAMCQAEQRWNTENQALQTALLSCQDEVNALRNQLDEARRLRFSMQTLSAELRGALNASLQQGKVLRARLNTLESAQMPDLTSSLPVPAMLDETALAELLQRSAAPPPPLTHLQSCLHNLQEEVDSLQKHLEQRNSLPKLNGNTV